MSRTCDLTNNGILYGNKVSHSAIKTSRKFLPNLQNVKLTSDCLKQTFYFKISTKTLRTINKYGSLDSFLINIGFNHLSEKGKTLRKKVMNILMKNGEYEKIKIVKKTISKNIDKAEQKAKKISKAGKEEAKKEVKKETRKETKKETKKEEVEIDPKEEIKTNKEENTEEK